MREEMEQMKAMGGGDGGLNEMMAKNGLTPDDIESKIASMGKMFENGELPAEYKLE